MSDDLQMNLKNSFNGWLLINKPVGLSSNDVVIRVKRMLRQYLTAEYTKNSSDEIIVHRNVIDERHNNSFDNRFDISIAEKMIKDDNLCANDTYMMNMSLDNVCTDIVLDSVDSAQQCKHLSSNHCRSCGTIAYSKSDFYSNIIESKSATIETLVSRKNITHSFSVSNHLSSKLFCANKLKLPKIGHCGTLDPMASGLLLVGIGSATKLMDTLHMFSKIYEFDLKWGLKTDSDDVTGNVVDESDVVPNIQDLIDGLEKFFGKIMQVPPKYSAIKIQGARCYEVMRKGGDVFIPAREVEIYHISHIRRQNNCDIFEVECSKGTYVRSLCRDIAQNLGGYGAASRIFRKKIGPFSINDAFDLDYLNNMVHNITDFIVPVTFLVRFLLSDSQSVVKCAEIDEKQAEKLRNGQSIAISSEYVGVVYCVLKDQLVAIAKVVELGTLQPMRCF